MIQSIQVENYRGIRKGELSDIPRIAVLTGPNGCGKSSVLEAMQLGTGSTQPADLLSRRTEIPNGQRWFTHQGTYGVANFRVTMQTGAVAEARLSNSLNRADVGFPKPPQEPGASFIEQRAGRPRSQLHQVFTETRIRGAVEDARKLLSEVDASIRGLEILTEGEKPVLHITYDDRVVPAALAGDGMESLVRLALELSQRKNGTFLIEEPEAHLHSAAILRTARILVAAARLGSQIVLSTHSLELIDDLLGAMNDSELSLLAVYRLRLAHGELKVHRVPGAEVRAARTEIGDDLR